LDGFNGGKGYVPDLYGDEAVAYKAIVGGANGVMWWAVSARTKNGTSEITIRLIPISSDYQKKFRH
jgi:hypothetical protein